MTDSKILQFPKSLSEEREPSRKRTSDILQSLIGEPQYTTPWDRLAGVSMDSIREILEDHFATPGPISSDNDQIAREIAQRKIVLFFLHLSMLADRCACSDSTVLSLERVANAFEDLRDGVTSPLFAPTLDSNGHPIANSIWAIRAYVVCSMNLLKQSGMPWKDVYAAVLKRGGLMPLARKQVISAETLESWRDNFAKKRGKRRDAVREYEEKMIELNVESKALSAEKIRALAFGLLEECVERARFLA